MEHVSLWPIYVLFAVLAAVAVYAILWGADGLLTVLRAGKRRKRKWGWRV